MTPQEKAEELIDEYLNLPINFPYIDTIDKQCIGSGYMTYYSAVKCAIVAVDEMIKELTDLWKILDKQKVFGASNPTTIKIKFYESVKTELEKLKN